MSWQKSLTFILMAVTNTRAFELKDMLCTDEFCTEYMKEKGCPPLSDACLTQNSTHNGVYLPFADVCNCCDYCMTNLAEGETCVRGVAGMLPPTTICGPGLACIRNETGPATCQPMLTDCMEAQRNWDHRRDEGTLGMTEVRPKCDNDGRYAPAHCIPGSICYCINTEGERLFGEVPFLNSWDEHKMTCECSINHQKARSLVELEFVDMMLAARCNDYGIFDPLQCMMGSKGYCLCVDPITGEPRKDTLVVPVSNLTKGQPSCFDPSVHNIGIYESECEIMKAESIEQSTTTTEMSVRQDTFVHPQCQPDGKYHRVQTLGTKRICVDPYGKKIENFEANIESPEANTMNCNCARTKWLLAKAGVNELPSCCPEGSFEAWQCYRNECFCVNHNGDQTEVEVNKRDLLKLSCFNGNQPCPVQSLQLD